MAKVLVYNGAHAGAAHSLVGVFRQATGGHYDVQAVTLEALHAAPWEASTCMIVLGPIDASDALWQPSDASRAALAKIRTWTEYGGILMAVGEAANHLCLVLEASGASSAGAAVTVPHGQGHLLLFRTANPSAGDLVPFLRSLKIHCGTQDAPAQQLSPLYVTALAAPLLDTWLQHLLAPASRTGTPPTWLKEAPTALAVWETIPAASVLEAWDATDALAVVAVRPSEWADVAPRTPHFRMDIYYEALSAARARSSVLPWPSPRSFQVSVGNLLVYGERVSSTQTLLESDRHLLRACPSGTTVIATHQVRGRGRAHNAWLSPLGCLPFSTTVHLPLHIGNKAVFLQYLAALAIVYGLEAAYPAIQGRVRIKWPNDIYAQVPTAQLGSVCLAADGQPRHFVKIGGILVTAVCEGDTFYAIVGCGVNCLNDEPTTSIQELAAQAGSTGVLLESCAGAIHAALESLLRVWADHAHSFAPFVPAYRRAWLHSDQVVTLVGAPGPPRRIVGVTSEHGLLRTVPVDAAVHASDAHAWLAPTVPGAVDVQPDGNSFDLLAGCVRPKN
ncbi:Similar to S.cerevisiae protein BPL1 (Biotin:apoprotein ligase) [Malassezia sympodialis ATCC 42132]|uniref:Similar to S.cerevisiae protein BPL1 (Biotin:apoprotein ligase) n=1 Tax=Malassezia sympodialis (strain ATCC 42132) TaxID=1230383 RepID=A0A1M8AAD3_MALS4|nr:Similar to S.cerevisiae protein BPL1 (Biotin:apoprotein ligase) [Malassezia sympodialis ATCC 42132]